jgi:hypothetical protein
VWDLRFSKYSLQQNVPLIATSLIALSNAGQVMVM